jgi:hypothetical protein
MFDGAPPWRLNSTIAARGESGGVCLFFQRDPEKKKNKNPEKN